MNNKKLFLDDIRVPEDCLSYMHLRIGHRNPIYLQEWDIVRNYNEFREWIEENGLPSHISFDHDLADEHYKDMSDADKYNSYYEDFKEKTGVDCAKFLIEYVKEHKLRMPVCYIHSMNPIGSRNILNTLENG